MSYLEAAELLPLGYWYTENGLIHSRQIVRSCANSGGPERSR